MARLSLIAVVTFGSVALSAVLSIVWFSDMSGPSRFAPVLHLFGLLSGLTGVLVGRWISAREGRHRALVTLIGELQRDASVLADSQYVPSKEASRPRVYPRLLVSATDAALTLGALTERSDDELLRHLHHWRDGVNGFNRRLELTEFLSFISGQPAEIADFERALDGSLNQIRRDLQELLDYLTVNYQIASENYEKSDGSGVPRGWRLFHGLRWLASRMPSIKAVRSAWSGWWRDSRR